LYLAFTYNKEILKKHKNRQQEDYQYRPHILIKKQPQKKGGDKDDLCVVLDLTYISTDT
jgi:hypothetical protein